MTQLSIALILLYGHYWMTAETTFSTAETHATMSPYTHNLQTSHTSTILPTSPTSPTLTTSPTPPSSTTSPTSPTSQTLTTSHSPSSSTTSPTSPTSPTLTTSPTPPSSTTSPIPSTPMTSPNLPASPTSHILPTTSPTSPNSSTSSDPPDSPPPPFDYYGDTPPPPPFDYYGAEAQQGVTLRLGHLFDVRLPNKKKPNVVGVRMHIQFIRPPDPTRDVMPIELYHEYHYTVLYEPFPDDSDMGIIRWIDDQVTESVYKEKDGVHPYVAIANDKAANFDPMTSAIYKKYYQGGLKVKFMAKMQHDIACAVHGSYYPFDQQVCNIYIVGVDTKPWTQRLEWYRGNASRVSPIILEDNHGLHDFDLVRYDADICHIEALEFAKYLPCLVIRLRMVRRTNLIMLTAFLPSISVQVICSASFWIDPTSVPARAAVGVTAVLSMITLLVKEISNFGYVTALEYWLMGNLFFTVMSLVEFIVVNVLIVKANKMKEESDLEGNLQLKMKQNTESSTAPSQAKHNDVGVVLVTHNKITPACSDEVSMVKKTSDWRKIARLANSVEQITRFMFPCLYTLCILGFIIFVKNYNHTPDIDDVTSLKSYIF